MIKLAGLTLNLKKSAVKGLVLLGLLLCQSTYAQTKKNLVFIAIDDLAPVLGAYGHQQVLTPNIDQLAREGVMFSKAYAQYPVCGPSRMNLMTGLRPENNGVLNLSTLLREVNPQATTLPEYLRQSGYQTAAAGKIFDPRNVDDKHDGNSWSVPYQKDSVEADKKGADKLAVKAIDAAEQQFVDGKIAARGLSLLTELATQDGPFFLAVGFKKPHLPFYAPKAFFDLYQADTLELANFQQLPMYSDESYVDSGSNELVKSYNFKETQGFESGNISPTQQRELLHGYYASVSFIDSLVGKLTDRIQQLGLSDNTVVVLWGDHGFHLGEFGLFGKHTVFEGAAHIPLLIKVPETQGFNSHALVETTDIFPTLVDLLDLPPVAGLDGISQKAVMDQSELQLRSGAVTQYKRNGAVAYSLRTQRFRYAEFWKQEQLVYRELYDLNADLEQVTNLIDSAEPLLLKQLHNELRLQSAGLNSLGSDSYPDIARLEQEVPDGRPTGGQPPSEPDSPPASDSNGSGQQPPEQEPTNEQSAGVVNIALLFVLLILKCFKPNNFSKKHCSNKRN